MTNILRSIVFNVFLIFGSLFLSFILLPALFFNTKDKAAQVIGDIYGGYILWITRHIMGIKLEYRGLENLPKEPCIIAAKHQSAFETLVIPFAGQFNYPAIILKIELTWLPLWGLYPPRMGGVAIDRGSGKEALASMSRGCKRAIDAGRNIIIFPQGTRVAVGVSKPYKNGLAKLYKDLNAPIAPMALNSGVFWGRNKFFKKAGTIVFEFLPVIPAGVPPLKAMAQLEEVLETASDKLVIEAGGPALQK